MNNQQTSEVRYTTDQAKAVISGLVADRLHELSPSISLLDTCRAFQIPSTAVLQRGQTGYWRVYRNKKREVVVLMVARQVRQQPGFWISCDHEITLYFSPPNDRKGGYTEFTADEAGAILHARDIKKAKTIFPTLNVGREYEGFHDELDEILARLGLPEVDRTMIGWTEMSTLYCDESGQVVAVTIFSGAGMGAPDLHVFPADGSDYMKFTGNDTKEILHAAGLVVEPRPSW
jgi:hypothetical protein